MNVFSSRHFMYTSLVICILSLTFCTTDYRTDYEKDNGIELTPEQIEVGKYNEIERRAAIGRDMRVVQDRMRMERMIRCHTNYLECW